MRDKKIKVLAHIMAYSMACFGCKSNVEAFINQAKPFLPKDGNFKPKNTVMEEYNSESAAETIWEKYFQNSKTEVVVVTCDTPLYIGNNENSLQIGIMYKGSTVEKILSCDNKWDLVQYGDQIGYVPRNVLKFTGERIEPEYHHESCKDIVVTTDSLNFRVAPNKSSDRISTFREGTELEVVATVDNGWYMVRYNGVLGYVLKDYTISLLEQANNCYPGLELKELDFKKVVYATTKLNFRAGNFNEAEWIGQLEKYETVRVIDEYSGWYFVMTNDRTFGFICAKYTADLSDKFVIVDIGEQRLYLYNDGQLYYTTPVTTGKDETPSDKGFYEIFEKKQNTFLMNDSFVSYWMQYTDTGEGLHDASWRSSFGTQRYRTNGSHGCVNMPTEITDDIYNSVEIGTPVIVHR